MKQPTVGDAKVELYEKAVAYPSMSVYDFEDTLTPEESILYDSVRPCILRCFLQKQYKHITQNYGKEKLVV